MSKSIEQRFEELCKIVQNLPKDGPIQLTNDQKLKFYAYYKQATEGDCNTSKPNFLKVVERAKWSAWNDIKGLGKQEAMKAYIDEMKKIMESGPKDNDIYPKISALING